MPSRLFKNSKMLISRKKYPLSDFYFYFILNVVETHFYIQPTYSLNITEK